MSTRTSPDIQTERDIRIIVDAFYEAIDRDPWIGRFFEGIDLPSHLPRMYAFWSSIVFQTGTYRGQPLDKHLRLEGLTEYHFQRWLERFHATVDAYFHGPRAGTMKSKATQIATVFQIKLGIWGNSAPNQTEASPLRLL